MKNIKKIAVFLVSIFFLAGCSVSAAQQNIGERISNSEEPVITWGVKADTNLFGYYSPEAGEIVGFEVDLARALTDEMTDGKGRAEFVEINSKTRIPMLKIGKIDAITGTMTANKDRETQVDFTDIYFRGGQSLLVPEDSPINSIDDLGSEHTVLAVKGSNSTQTFRQMKPEVNVVDLENYSEAFVALQSGQGDALTTDNAILLGMIARNPGYRLAGENFTKEYYGVAVNEHQDEFHYMLNQAIDTLQENGVYDELYDKWFSELLPADDEASSSTSKTGAAYYGSEEAIYEVDHYTDDIREEIGEPQPMSDESLRLRDEALN